jgi:hypothetical protein
VKNLWQIWVSFFFIFASSLSMSDYSYELLFI